MVVYIDGSCRGPPPHLVVHIKRPGSHAGGSAPLSRGVDVQLALQDVVDDGLAQVVHHVSVSVLQGQSRGGGRGSDFILTLTDIYTLRFQLGLGFGGALTAGANPKAPFSNKDSFSLS